MTSIGKQAIVNSFTHNYYIDLFRFLLMSWIVLFHYTVQYNTLELDKSFSFPISFVNGGTIGVSLFFMVSGFFMTKAIMTDKSGLREFGSYIVKRYLRLWIPYAFACIIIWFWLFILPIEGRTVDFTTLLANVVCIIHPGFDRVDNAHWFIADLIVVQMLLGLLLLIRSCKSRQIIVDISFVVIMFSQVITLPVLSGFSKELFEVFLGVQLCRMTNKNDLKNALLPIIGLMVVLYVSIVFFVGALLFILLLYLGKQYPPPSTKGMLQSILQFAGTSSFYWYLVHQNIGYSIMYYYLPNSTNNELLVLIPMSITVLISVVVFMFDKQFNKGVIKKIHFIKH